MKATRGLKAWKEIVMDKKRYASQGAKARITKKERHPHFI